MKTVFSIVVAACNVEKYVVKCIESIKRQTFVDFEVFVVCEESSDATLELARKTTADDSRFSVVSLPRSGSASVSRNYGIENATGEYMVFIDGDDWIEPDSLSRFADACKQYDSPEILTTSYTYWEEHSDGTVEKSAYQNMKHFHDGECFVGHDALALFMSDNSFVPATWHAIYKRSFLVKFGLKQVPSRRHQDDEWTPRVYFYAKRVAVSDIAYYNYLKRANSVTTKLLPATLFDVLLNVESHLEFYESNFFSPALSRQWIRRICFDLTRYFGLSWRNSYTRRERKTVLLGFLAKRENRERFGRILHFAPRTDYVFGHLLLVLFHFPFLWVLLEKFVALTYGRSK